MSRTSVTPGDSQVTADITLSLPKLSMGNDYAIVSDSPGESAIRNIISDVNLEEKISFKYSKLPEVNTSIKGVYPRTTKNGYQIIVKDEFIQRTTEDDGTVHDDPVTAYITFRTTSGANITSGADVLAVINRVLSACILQTGATSSTTPLDRLMRGATKPAALV